jgi:AbrB family looped-hinge helix DNA binding protein
MMALATVTSKGQVTIPKAVREKLKIGTGDKIEFIFTDDRSALIRPVSKSVDDLFGKLAQPGRKCVSVEEMNAAIVRKIKADFS